MSESAINNKRIAKNTVYMYARMFITMLIGLYTSRAVLAALGFEDYGLYNVIGGIIAMLGFINGAMTSTTSRYITFYLGKSNVKRLQEVFSTAFYIHLALALLIVILGETVGLWYVCNKLVIPEGRYTAALWLYQFTIVSTAANIISIPFSASIIAHEKMSAFAVIAIIDAVLKMLIAISLSFISFDKLIYYGAMILVIQLLNDAIYWVYSVKRFEGIRIRAVFDKLMLKEMFGFTGWNLFGSFSYLFFTQGVNLILNFFFGTVVNAARGIAIQVDSLVRQFATNVQTAINPQIIKSYAQNERDRFFTLIFASSRYCFYLIFLIALPIILEADFLLSLWLGEYPDHTVNFLRITLITVTLETLVTPMFTANLASGKVKIYQLVMSIISLLFIPITFMAIKLTTLPEIVFYCTLMMTIVEIIARIFIVHRQVGLPRRRYVNNVIQNVLIVSIISSIVPLVVYKSMPQSTTRFFVVCLICVLSVGIVVYYVGINKKERKIANNIIGAKFKALMKFN